MAVSHGFVIVVHCVVSMTLLDSYPILTDYFWVYGPDDDDSPHSIMCSHTCKVYTDGLLSAIVQ